MSPILGPECRAFLRRLEEHAAEVRGGGAVRGHAVECSPCRERLRAANVLAAMLRQRPASPPALQAPAFFEGIHQQLVETFEATTPGLGSALRNGIPGAAPAALPWPAAALVTPLESALREQPGRAPDWMWARVRAGVRSLVAPRNASGSSRRRAGVLAASIALFALLGWKIGTRQGTSDELQIVFVPVADMPSVLHPTAVLRHGVLR